MARYKRAKYNEEVKGDCISYSEKVGRLLFPMVDSGCKYQYKPEWSNGKVYDFYLPKYNMIIELHGEQHYNPRGFMTDQTHNDALKENMARDNGIELYYQVDCRLSTRDHVQANLLKIKEIEWGNIEWDGLFEQAELDLVKLVCDYKAEHDEANILELSEIFGLSTHAIRTYVAKGASLGWCNYNFRELQYKVNSDKYKGVGNPNPSKVVIAYKDGVEVGEYQTLEECCNPEVNGLGITFQKSKVSNVCTGQRKTHKGHTFKYKQDIITLND